MLASQTKLPLAQQQRGRQVQLLVHGAVERFSQAGLQPLILLAQRQHLRRGGWMMV